MLMRNVVGVVVVVDDDDEDGNAERGPLRP